MQRVIRLAKFLFVQKPALGIQSRTAYLFGHVRGIKPCCHSFFLDVTNQIHVQPAAAFDLGLMRVKFAFHKSSGGIDDHRLFVGQSEIHVTPAGLG